MARALAFNATLLAVHAHHDVCDGEALPCVSNQNPAHEVLALLADFLGRGPRVFRCTANAKSDGDCGE